MGSEFSVVEAKMDYSEIITVEPDKCGGRPCIRGMRITVDTILDYLASGMSREEILQDFSYLTEKDISACLQYEADQNLSEENKQKPRIAGLHAGSVWWMSDDFDGPLPDSFWLGEE